MGDYSPILCYICKQIYKIGTSCQNIYYFCIVNWDIVILKKPTLRLSRGQRLLADFVEVVQ